MMGNPEHMPGMVQGDSGGMFGAMGVRLVLTNIEGRVIADTGGGLLEQTLSPSVLTQGTPVVVGDEMVGTLLAIQPEHSAPARSAFLGGVRRAVLLAAVTAGLFALGIGTLISQRITKPLRQLQTAAQTVAAGDLDTRVSVASNDEVGALAGAFNQMAEQLSEQQKLRKQMVADIAHELRTPISIMQGTLEAMLDGVLKPTPAELRDLHGDVQRFARLVEDLRTLSLADAGQLTLMRGPVDVAALAEQVGGRMAVIADGVGIDLQVEADRALPPVNADDDRLAQVLANLLDNALRHTPRGGHVVVRVRRQNNHLALEVSDDGPGILASDLPYVFERFWRGDRSRSRGSGGSGLGLAIVRQLVEAHGGAVAAESAPGMGTTFRVLLPL
jgi:signal transduction histidine kinase